MNHREYTLFMSQRSPFARRIRLALARLQFSAQELPIDVFQQNVEFWNLNPLGMVPTLLAPEGIALSDSSAILEYLHEKTGRIWCDSFADRTLERQTSVWCKGIMQSSILFFQEKFMHEAPSPRWLEEHATSICDTLLHLSKLNGSVWEKNKILTQPAWDLAVALQYCSLRLPEIKWEEQYPAFQKLVATALQDSFFRESQPLV
jgi:glutathione S-transferase